MPRADARHAAGENLAAFLDELRKNVGALVVDEIHLLDTKLADFLLAEILALSAAWTSGSTWPTLAAASAGMPAFAAGRTRSAVPARRTGSAGCAWSASCRRGAPTAFAG